ncbi:MAG: TatD family hydrolase [Desulfobacterota bacterium]|nr:TatD family hydrolase [Thermodesulfobacteriota bacterium]
MLIDSHAHLEMPEYEKDLEEVLQRAKDQGVGYIFTVGTERGDWERTLQIAEAHEFVYALLGVHPHNAREIDEGTYPLLRRLCRHKKVKALGEIGLDFYRNRSPREVQVERFREQIALAREFKLPIVIHDRDAHRETLEILKSEKGWENGGVIHCFSGDGAMAKACIDLGFYISIPGSITYKNSGPYQELVKELPLNSLLIETDAPFLTPVPFRGKRNEPGYVRYTAEKIAAIKGVSFEEVAEATTENAKKVFRVK